MQFPVPAQEVPLHPVNTEPPGADAVRTTEVPLLYKAEQAAPQLIPAGALVTVPEPPPLFVTDNVDCGIGEKVAVAATELVPTVKLHAPVPEQAPVQPANTEFDAADAFNVTGLPEL